MAYRLVASEWDAGQGCLPSGKIYKPSRIGARDGRKIFGHVLIPKIATIVTPPSQRVSYY